MVYFRKLQRGRKRRRGNIHRAKNEGDAARMRERNRKVPITRRCGNEVNRGHRTTQDVTEKPKENEKRVSG